MTNKNRVRHLTEAALIAAMYAALTFAIAPLAYGEVQFRVSEALTILPVFTPAAIPGLTVGCLLANLLGLLSGANPAGTLDMVFGTLGRHCLRMHCAMCGSRDCRCWRHCPP